MSHDMVMSVVSLGPSVVSRSVVLEVSVVEKLVDDDPAKLVDDDSASDVPTLVPGAGTQTLPKHSRPGAHWARSSHTQNAVPGRQSSGGSPDVVVGSRSPVDPSFDATHCPVSPAPANSPYRRPDGHFGSSKLQNPVGSHCPSPPHPASSWQLKLTGALQPVNKSNPRQVRAQPITASVYRFDNTPWPGLLDCTGFPTRRFSLALCRREGNSRSPRNRSQRSRRAALSPTLTDADGRNTSSRGQRIPHTRMTWDWGNLQLRNSPWVGSRSGCCSRATAVTTERQP